MSSSKPSSAGPRAARDWARIRRAHSESGSSRTAPARTTYTGSSSFGSRRHYCFSHAAYRAEAIRITAALAERYGRHLGLGAWQTDNEYGCHDTTLSYSDAARAALMGSTGARGSACSTKARSPARTAWARTSSASMSSRWQITDSAPDDGVEATLRTELPDVLEAGQRLSLQVQVRAAYDAADSASFALTLSNDQGASREASIATVQLAVAMWLCRWRTPRAFR